MGRRAILVAILILATMFPVGLFARQNDGQWWGRVGGVTDGDTLMVLHKQRWPVHLSLFGVDTPELAQPFGKEARELTVKTVYGKQVRVVPKGKDNKGKPLVLIYVGAECLNEGLLKAGLAWLSRGHKSSKYEALVKKAKAAAKGLWADASSVPPWRWTPAKNSAQRTESRDDSRSESRARRVREDNKHVRAGDLNDALDSIGGKRKAKTTTVAIVGSSSKDRACRRHSDCVFRFRTPCHCAPCGGVWRQATNRKAYRRIQRVWAKKKPVCKPCPLCVQPTIWLGKKALCIKGQCMVR